MKYLIDMDYTLRQTLLFSLFFLSGFLTFYFNSLFLALLTLSIFGLIIYVNGEYDKKYFAKVIDSLPSALEKVQYKANDKYLSDDFISGIAINYEEENIAVATRSHRDHEFNIDILPFSSILESELREDNITLLKTSKGSTIGGALVGGALAGGVGAIVGGMTGSKTGTEKAHRLTLVLVINDIVNPVYEINFINNPAGTPKSSPLYEEIRSKATKWHKTISVILSKNKSHSSV